MPGIAVGQAAPSFRLPSAQGPEIGLEDFRGKKNVVVWFTKGMACPGRVGGRKRTDLAGDTLYFLLEAMPLFG